MTDPHTELKLRYAAAVHQAQIAALLPVERPGDAVAIYDAAKRLIALCEGDKGISKAIESED